MSVTRGATISDTKITATTTDGSIAHTVDSGTDLLLVYIGTEGGEAISGTPQWSLGGNLTLIDQFGASGNAGDCIGYWYGLVSPASGAGTVTITFTSNVNPAWTAAINYIGVDTASVAAATNFLSEDVNDTATSTAVHASAGTAGNALIFGGHGQGEDMNPSSNATGFTEVFDTQTGTSKTADFACNISELLDSAPAAITVTWGASDENTSGYIELVIPRRTVICATEVLTLTANAATIQRGASDLAVTCSTEVLELTEPVATINRTRTVICSTEALTLTETAATIKKDRAVVTATETLVVSSSATVNRERAVNCAVEQLSLAGTASTINRTRNVACSTEVLVLAEPQATIARDRDVSCSTEVLKLTAMLATIKKESGYRQMTRTY